MKAIIFVLVGILNVTFQRELPSYIHKCRLSEDVSACLSQNINNLRDHLAKGIPELQVPAIEPLLVPKADLKSPSPDGLAAHFTDIEVHNSISYELKKLDFNPESGKIYVNLYIPHLNVEANYKLEGKILFLQLNGQGKGRANIENVDATLEYQLTPYDKKGKEFYRIKRTAADLKYKVSLLQFDNLFEGRDDLTASTNQVLNDNIEEVMKEFKPLVDDTTLAVIDSVLERVHERFSKDDLYDK